VTTGPEAPESPHFQAYFGTTVCVERFERVGDGANQWTQRVLAECCQIEHAARSPRRRPSRNGPSGVNGHIDVSQRTHSTSGAVEPSCLGFDGRVELNHDYANRLPEDEGLGLEDMTASIPGLIVIGRRNRRDAERRRFRDALGRQLGIAIHTYDWLLERVEGSARTLESSRRQRSRS
jgi:hypothetical protein